MLCRGAGAGAGPTWRVRSGCGRCAGRRAQGGGCRAEGAGQRVPGPWEPRSRALHRGSMQGAECLGAPSLNGVARVGHSDFEASPGGCGVCPRLPSVSDVLKMIKFWIH